jgi:hypothetical protein
LEYEPFVQTFDCAMHVVELRQPPEIASACSFVSFLPWGAFFFFVVMGFSALLGIRASLNPGWDIGPRVAMLRPPSGARQREVNNVSNVTPAQPHAPRYW